MPSASKVSLSPSPPVVVMTSSSSSSSLRPTTTTPPANSWCRVASSPSSKPATARRGAAWAIDRRRAWEMARSQPNDTTAAALLAPSPSAAEAAARSMPAANSHRRLPVSSRRRSANTLEGRGLRRRRGLWLCDCWSRLALSFLPSAVTGPVSDSRVPTGSACLWWLTDRHAVSKTSCKTVALPHVFDKRQEYSTCVALSPSSTSSRWSRREKVAREIREAKSVMGLPPMSLLSARVSEPLMLQSRQAVTATWTKRISARVTSRSAPGTTPWACQCGTAGGADTP
mmetsp:Transcript_16583/g.33847  ORF Transcript_16583/g.33847 Transcript_16583/m.33847 type:complete len:285 (-) Transcript_16583:302-1156(-)